MLRIPEKWSVAAALLVPILLADPALAQDKLRIGKSVPNSWAFAATNVGVQSGIFKQEGIELAISSFRGDAQMQAGLTAGAVDVALGSGPGLGFRAKGVPAIGVAAMYGAPRNLAVVVLDKSAIKTVADLKGKRIGVTSGGSLTDWLSRELSRQQGWGRDGMQVMPLGAMQARLAAMERGDLDAMVVESASGFELEELKKGRILINFGDIEKNFYTHVIFATDNMVQKRADVLRRFLRGWFKTIAFIRANKDATVKITAKAIDVRESIVSRVYDAQVGGFSPDGSWDPKAIEVIRKSLKQLGILDSVPDARTLYNDQFVPVKL
ncbi:MAG: transporter substrate-binding domain-containing protein [Rhizobiales bacterium]|nr:transporter substrate-binding domain-containing protein [Hyphomicrobiales bacterium]